MGLIGNFSLLANELVNIYYNENHPLVSTETGRTWNKRPLTFGRWLEKNKKTAQSVLDDAFLLNRVSRDLLMDIGIPHPSQHQLHETRFALSVAVKKDKFEDFTSPTIQGVLDVEFGSDCCSGNVFFEREAYGSRALTSEALKLSKRNKYRLKTGYADGCLGQVVAATFISGSNRSSSDFSHAYGDEPWACYLQAWNMLDQIPQGQFVENLDIDMITKTNKLIHAPDPRGGSIFYRAVGAVTRGRLDVAGRIREGRTLSQMYTFTHEEIKNLTELGISFYGLPSLGSSTQSGIMEYPAPTVIRGRMQELIDELKEELAKEDADVIGLAAKFCRELVAIHPYEDSNGRMARVLMNRILMDFGYPPAILSHADKDLTMDAESWREEVLEGIAHTKRYLDKTNLFSNDRLLGKEKIIIPGYSGPKTFSLSGLPFCLGTDGFIYDVTGRPHLADGDEIKPLSQLEYYGLARRFIALPKYQAIEKLQELTAKTRALVEKVTQGTIDGSTVAVGDDKSAREADSKFSIRGDSFIMERLIDLMDVDNINLSNIFQIHQARGTKMSSLMSKYNQLDHEYWSIENTLKSVENSKLAAMVHVQRENFFAKAKEKLEGYMPQDPKSEQNPHGFHYTSEQLMYQRSPLRFASLADAIKHDGDDNVTIWRGDYAFARAIGMAPNNDPRQPAARKHAQAKFERHTVPHLLQELKALEQSGIGSHYISHTTDLSLLTEKFAEKEKSTTINLSPFPSIVVSGIKSVLSDNTKTQNTMTALAPISTKIGVSIRNALTVPSDILGLRQGKSKGDTLEIVATRKAFELNVAKKSIIPGMLSLSGSHPFANEQEVHGLEYVSPFEISATYTSDQLRKSLLVEVSPSSYETTPDMDKTA